MPHNALESHGGGVIRVFTLQSSVRGCHLLSFWLFDYFVIKVYVYGQLVPASFFPELWTVLHLCRNTGG